MRWQSLQRQRDPVHDPCVFPCLLADATVMVAAVYLSRDFSLPLGGGGTKTTHSASQPTSTLIRLQQHFVFSLPLAHSQTERERDREREAEREIERESEPWMW